MSTSTKGQQEQQARSKCLAAVWRLDGHYTPMPRVLTEAREAVRRRLSEVYAASGAKWRPQTMVIIDGVAAQTGFSGKQTGVCEPDIPRIAKLNGIDPHYAGQMMNLMGKVRYRGMRLLVATATNRRTWRTSAYDLSGLSLLLADLSAELGIECRYLGQYMDGGTCTHDAAQDEKSGVQVPTHEGGVCPPEGGHVPSSIRAEPETDLDTSTLEIPADIFPKKMSAEARAGEEQEQWAEEARSTTGEPQLAQVDREASEVVKTKAEALVDAYYLARGEKPPVDYGRGNDVAGVLAFMDWSTGGTDWDVAWDSLEEAMAYQIVNLPGLWPSNLGASSVWGDGTPMANALLLDAEAEGFDPEVELGPERWAKLRSWRNTWQEEPLTTRHESEQQDQACSDAPLKAPDPRERFISEITTDPELAEWWQANGLSSTAQTLAGTAYSAGIDSAEAFKCLVVRPLGEGADRQAVMSHLMSRPWQASPVAMASKVEVSLHLPEKWGTADPVARA